MGLTGVPRSFSIGLMGLSVLTGVTNLKVSFSQHVTSWE